VSGARQHVLWLFGIVEKETIMSEVNQELDARGLNCPLPILRAKKAINGMATGEVLKVLATDPGAVKDFEAFCKQTGNELLQSANAGDGFEFLIRKH
jgi:tRNA 2-thiouridine synthesizing protein A